MVVFLACDDRASLPPLPPPVCPQLECMLDRSTKRSRIPLSYSQQTDAGYDYHPGIETPPKRILVPEMMSYNTMILELLTMRGLRDGVFHGEQTAGGK